MQKKSSQRLRATCLADWFWNIFLTVLHIRLNVLTSLAKKKNLSASRERVLTLPWSWTPWRTSCHRESGTTYWSTTYWVFIYSFSILLCSGQQMITDLQLFQKVCHRARFLCFLTLWRTLTSQNIVDDSADYAVLFLVISELGKWDCNIDLPQGAGVTLDWLQAKD